MVPHGSLQQKHCHGWLCRALITQAAPKNLRIMHLPPSCLPMTYALFSSQPPICRAEQGKVGVWPPPTTVVYTCLYCYSHQKRYIVVIAIVNHPQNHHFYEWVVVALQTLGRSSDLGGYKSVCFRVKSAVSAPSLRIGGFHGGYPKWVKMDGL